MTIKFSNRSIDVIAFSQQLQRYIATKTQDHTLLNRYSDNVDQCKQFIFDIQLELQHLSKLNQPKQHIPERLQRFPFKYVKGFSQKLIKLYNYLSGPQRNINNLLQTINTYHVRIDQQLLLQQQKHQSEVGKQLLTLHQQLNALTQRVEQMEQSESGFDRRSIQKEPSPSLRQFYPTSSGRPKAGEGNGQNDGRNPQPTSLEKSLL